MHCNMIGKLLNPSVLHLISERKEKDRLVAVPPKYLGYSGGWAP